MRAVLVVAARLAAALGLMAVATYYLLASIPFSYYHFLQFPHFTWQPLFIRLHPLVLLAAVAGLLATTRRRPGGAAPGARYVAIAAVTAAACMAVAVIVPAMLSYEVAAALAFVPLALLAGAAAVQLQTRGEASPQATRRDGVAAVWLAGIAGTLCSAAYGLQGWSRTAASGQSGAEVLFAGVTSLASHVAAFMLAASALAFVWAIAARRGWQAGLERLVTSALAAGLLALVIRRSLMTALILSDVRAIGLATAFALAIVIFGESLVPPRQSGPPRRGLLIAAGAVVAALCVAILPHALLLADWGSTLQKLLVLGTWASCVALSAGLTIGRSRRRVLAGAVCCVLAGITTVAAVAPRGHARGTADLRRPLDVRLAIERYAVFDTSLSVLLDLFRPMVTDGAFFGALRRAGDATDDRSLAPVSLRLLEGQDAPAPYRPHIFVVVVDSMRPDYLSPYNPKVTFTPAIAAFARESIVMRRAYTPYAGTALSQPAIWAGGLIQRAQYVKPFGALNNLERLLGANSYRRYLSVDEILSVILEDWRDVVRLDGHLVHPERKDEMFKFDVCTTIDELKGRLDRDNFEQPVFFYSQPQSLHIRVLAGDEYPPSLDTRSANSDFFPPVVSALERIDTCLGGLIDYLKRRGVYENSVVVLTSDHGDSYGEGGRWGHAFYVAPEILRIPLIIHVPSVVRETRRWDADALALLTDVTPTLYDLMGYPPAPPDGLRGRSLLFPRTGPAPPARPFVLIQGSYSRIFGLLDGEARWMYTADASRNREALFDMRDGGMEEAALPPADRIQFRGWLLERLGEVGRFYVGHDVE